MRAPVLRSQGGRRSAAIVVAPAIALVVLCACTGPASPVADPRTGSGASGRGTPTASGTNPSGATASGATASGPAPNPVPTAATVRGVALDGRLARFLRARLGDVSASVYDVRTGTWFGYHPQEEHQTASVVKLAILGAVLRLAQEGRVTLGPAERDEMRRMIEVSDNDAATALWNLAGGPDGIAAFARLAGLWETEPDVHWGLTVTTTTNQVALLRLFAAPNRVLGQAARRIAMRLIANVDPTQRWGVSSGVAPGALRGIKDGWIGEPGEGWVVNSIGYVRGEGREYFVAVLSDRDPGYDYGIATIERASRIVWGALAPAD
jgi:beta-lactamase class A